MKKTYFSMEDFNWLNKDSRTFLEKDYLLPGVTPEERIRQISNTAERILGIEGFSDKFYGYMAKGFYSLATPVWMNFGLDRGLPISCYGIDIQDDTFDILRATAEIGALTKMGGGTAGYFGKLRGRGAPIKNNGVSNGAVSFLLPFQTTTDVITQGQARRGYFAAYYPVDGPDIEEFLQCRSEGNIIQNIALGVCISDEWMEAVQDGDKEKRKILAKIHQKRAESGFPYIFFTGNVNKSKPRVYKDKDLEINHSQMCVTGDQRVVTDRGIKTALELYNEKGELNLFDNEKVVKSTKMTLIEKDAEVYEILLDNGLTHKVTDYHKIKTFVGKGNKGYKFEDRECKDLRVGDKVAIQTNKGIFGKGDYVKEAFLLGLYQSDGTQSNSSLHFDIWENDFDLIERIEDYIEILSEKYNYKPRYSCKGSRFINCNTGQSSISKKRLTTQLFNNSGLEFKKGNIPNWIWEANEETVWSYLEGLLIADGTAYLADKEKGLVKVEYADVNMEFLKDLQILFNNLGLNTSINLLREGGISLLPNGKGGYSEYFSKPCYRLSINNKKALKQVEKNTGFLSRKDINIYDYNEGKNSRITAKIVAIRYLGEEDVYCVTVNSDEHHWVCNGVITHNCTEILEYTDEHKSFVCCLSSLNLLHWDEIADTDAIETLAYFLDAVYSEFIEKAEGVPFMEKALLFAKEHRSIGIGVLGWHSFLQSKLIPFEGLESKMLNAEIFRIIDNKSLHASIQLATMFGEPEMLKGYGERFTTRLAIAPTTSSSFILGQVSPSIEPLQSNYFIKDLAKGKFVYRNPYLKKLLKSKKQDTPEVWNSILLKGGSVQHLDILDSKEKSVFKTFGELSQLEIVQQAAQRQKFIDQGQSLNLMIHPDTSLKDVNALFFEAWQLGIKTLYYQRSVNMAQEVSRNLMDCSSCEG